MDSVFEEEQQHLSETFAKLQDIERQVADDLKRTLAEASEDKGEMARDLALDFTSDDMSMETYADLEAINRIIDAYSLASQLSTEKLSKVQLLLHQPYFAKVSLVFKPGEPARDVYLGATGMTDDTCRHFIVDWRSPIAETYYNQENGSTSYEAHGRTIACELVLRRQFDVLRDKLNAYFDTTVAIQDPLLLASLAHNRTSQLKAITATIQKEQNRVIRHEDVPALLVSGIAGSGKTSVLLQRIAFLFYRQRENLRPQDVYLMSPNAIFGAYISDVLPDMGEANPHMLTWQDLMSLLGMESRRACDDPSGESLARIDQAVSLMSFEPDDFCDLRVGDERVITASQVRNAMAKHRSVPAGPRLAGLVEEGLLEKLQQRIKRLSKSENVHDDIGELDLDEQIRIFGHLAQPDSEDEACALALVYLKDRYRCVEESIENADWLRVDRIGMRLLGSDNLSAEEWLYLKMAMTGYGNRHARYVMIDEVQDYTAAQLAVMARYFRNAHFLMLGDENQAMRPGTATFDQIRELFARSKGQVHECELMTSYRSSPEITKLFCSLLPPEQRVKATSVQPEGRESRIVSCGDDAYVGTVRESVACHAEEDGLHAVIVADKGRARWMARMLGEAATLVSSGSQKLPEAGTIVIPLKLAKGLEFDTVVIADAQESVYGADVISRHRLYTAISRATKEVTIISQGAMTPLLSPTETGSGK
jgi:DNA helicase-2/ATP-dependent DNA helicase PcrA